MKTKKILIVDDDAHFSERISIVLTNAGYDCLIAANAKDGLAQIDSYKPDLILLDFVLPDTNAIGFLKLMKTKTEAAGMPVILVSAKDDIATKMTSFSAGATRYMAKPIADAELLRELDLTFRQVEISKKLKKCNEDGVNEGDFGGAECKLSDD